MTREDRLRLAEFLAREPLVSEEEARSELGLTPKWMEELSSPTTPEPKKEIRRPSDRKPVLA